MNLQKPCVGAARPLALVPITGQDFTPGLGWDGCSVALTRLADDGIAGHALVIGPAQATAIRFGFAAIGALMDVDLDYPPGGGFL